MKELAAACGLKILAGSRGSARRITSAALSRPSFPFSGKPGKDRGKVQFLGPGALEALSSLPAGRQRKAADGIIGSEGAAVVVPQLSQVPDALTSACRRRNRPLLLVDKPPGPALKALRAFLKERLSLEMSCHGVLMEVLGVGVLIRGPSGIGKSESALDLVMRGHRLIADDLVIIRRADETRLVGRAPEMARSHMEVRGVGIINIEDLFGVSAVLSSKEINLVVDLREWGSHLIADRLGLEEKYCSLLGVKVEHLHVPVSCGRNIAVILEVAARNYLLKARGGFTAKEFERKLARRLSDGDADFRGTHREK